MDRFPEFWNQIETNLDLDPNGIQSIKELLTLLEYKTIQSITKFAKNGEIELLEREFIHFKKSNPSLLANYPNLLNLKFCSGFFSTLTDIAKKIKKRFIGFDHAQIECAVFNDIKTICSEIQMIHVCIKSGDAEANCVVTCPKCLLNITLPKYWTEIGPTFRISIFKKHLVSCKTINFNGPKQSTSSVKRLQKRITSTSRTMLKSRTPLSALDNLINLGRSESISVQSNVQSTEWHEQNETLRSELTDARAEICRLNGLLNTEPLKNLSIEVETLRHQIQREKTNINNLNVQSIEHMKQCTAEKHDLQTKLNNALTELRHLRENSNSELMNQFKTENERLRVEIDAYRHELTDLNQKGSEMCKKLIAENEVLKTRASQTLNEASRLNNEHKTIESIQKSEIENESLRSQLSAAYAEINDLNKENAKQLEETTKQNEAYMTNMTESVAEIQHLNEELSNIRTEMSRLNNERKNLLHMNLELRGKVRVFCRLRPTLQNELHLNAINYNIVSMEKLEISNSTNGTKNEFKLNKIFDSKSTQFDMFDEVTPLLQSAIDGHNICVFAYGQTGSGKTFTMTGRDDSPGIFPRTVEYLFDQIETNRGYGRSFKVRLSCCELYNEVLFDLLQTKPTQIKVNTYKKGQSQVEIANRDELENLLNAAISRRKTSATINNISSSRSHFLIQIQLTCIAQNETTVSHINLIDLAGSESGNTSQCMAETTSINKSLLGLSKFFISLKQKNAFISFRDSMLTEILHLHLTGGSKVLMIVNISTLEKNVNESLRTLRFAQDVSQINIKKTVRNVQSEKN